MFRVPEFRIKQRGLYLKCSVQTLLVETVGSQLTERFQIAKIRVKDFWHYQHRLYRKILSHTVAVCLNLQLALPPLHFALLASA